MPTIDADGCPINVEIEGPDAFVGFMRGVSRGEKKCDTWR